jgi:PAS domain S-box-containing protein
MPDLIVHKTVIQENFEIQPKLWNVAIIGGGSKCLNFLEMLANDYRYLLKMTVVAVAIQGEDGLGSDFAYRWGVPIIVSDYKELFSHNEIDILIELTGNKQLASKIARTKPEQMHFIDYVGAMFFFELSKIASEKEHVEKKSARDILLSQFKLQETQEFLQNVLKNSPDIIFTTDTNGKVLTINSGVESILGKKPLEIIGKNVMQCAGDGEYFSKVFEQALKRGNAYEDDMTFLHKSGNPIFCRVSLTTISDENQKTTGILGICRDITLRKRLQSDLVNSDRLAAIGKMAAGIAHEINNPLAVISETASWMTELLESAPEVPNELKQELIESSAQILRQLKRCKAITQGLLGFSRKSLPASSEFNLHDLIENALVLLQYEIKYAQIRFDKQFDPLLPLIVSDPQKLEQVIVNLFTNAIYAIKIKENPKDGLIKIATKAYNDKAKIIIEDNGIGISEDHLKKIFDVFFTTKPQGQGTGLGLSICQDIVKNLGGAITVQSAFGAGTSFIIELPLIKK